MPDSCTIFVNSSTNSGTPPVRSQICSISASGTAPPSFAASSRRPAARVRRFSARLVWWATAGQGVWNSGRKVSKVKTRSCRPSARNCPRNSREDASTQCKSSTMNRTGRRPAVRAEPLAHGPKRLFPFAGPETSREAESGRPVEATGATRTAARRPAGPGRTHPGGGPAGRTGTVGGSSRPKPRNRSKKSAAGYRPVFWKCGEQRHSTTGESSSA